MNLKYDIEQKRWVPLKQVITPQSKEKDNLNEVFILITSMVFIAFLLGAKLGHDDGEVYQRKLAIKAGVAHYVADEQGNSKFEYKK